MAGAIRATTARARDARGGFALIEVMIALLMIALIAAIAMPGLVRPTGPGTLRVAAMNVAALLRNARNLALANGRATAATAAGGAVRSAGTDASVAMPPGAVAGPVGATIRFTPDGRASGGPLTLASSSGLYVIGVNPDSGAIDVSTR